MKVGKTGEFAEMAGQVDGDEQNNGNAHRREEVDYKKLESKRSTE